MSRKHCSFPGCAGGCHWCGAVNKQRADRATFEAALRLSKFALDADARTVVEYVLDRTAPAIDERNHRWYDDWQQRAIRAGVIAPGWESS